MKKNKNAFTLIELLAVIVILAVIALIATPIILGIVEDAKKDAFLRSVELVISTTDIDIANKTFEEEYTYTITDGDISNLEVSVKNTDGMNGSITYDVNGKEVYAIPNGVYCVKKTEDMAKAEISDYVEGECTLTVQPTTYANGQRVYFDVYAGTGCTMEKYSESYENGDYANSLTGYNGLNGTGKQNNCLLFYAFNDDGGETINLILDHNTIGITYWTNSSTSSNTDGPITVLSELKTATANWNGTITPADYSVEQEGYGNYTIPYTTDANGVYKARLITAQEIAQITGADTKEGLMFNESSTSYRNSFYFDSLSSSASDTCKSGNTTGCSYGWLYDRTSIYCKVYGCYNNADSSMSGYGYWTSTSGHGNSGFVWNVDRDGYLHSTSVRNADVYGARPVIEVLKSKVSPGVAPVIPAS